MSFSQCIRSVERTAVSLGASLTYTTNLNRPTLVSISRRNMVRNSLNSLGLASVGPRRPRRPSESPGANRCLGGAGSAVEGLQNEVLVLGSWNTSCTPTLSVRGLPDCAVIIGAQDSANETDGIHQRDWLMPLWLRWRKTSYQLALANLQGKEHVGC